MNYWGKARPAMVEGPRWHPLAYHSLDVAAVGYALLKTDPRLRTRLVAISGLDETVVCRWAFLARIIHALKGRCVASVD
jgi:CRISPR-associated endonuclease/helicase Cas3